MAWAKNSMSDETQLVTGQILCADRARHLPLWQLETFNPDQQLTARRRPQSEAEKSAIQAALLKTQQDDARQLAAAQVAVQAEQASSGAASSPIEPDPLLDPAEVERIKAGAFDEGYAAGYDQGGAAARREAERWHALIEASSNVFTRFEAELAPQLLNLALEVARQVVRRELNTDNNVILAVVRDAFKQLTGGEANKQLRLHPSDVQLVRAHLGDELELGQWKIVEEEDIEPGGCRISTLQSELDATLQTRWLRTVATLGSNSAWDSSRG